MSEFEEIIMNFKTLEDFEEALRYQYFLGFTKSDTFPSFLLEEMKKFKKS